MILQKNRVPFVIILACLWSLCLVAGCISSSIQNNSETLISTSQPTTIPTTQSYVKEATPFSTPTQTLSQVSFTPVTQPTKIFEEYVCLVYQKEKVIFFNGTAISFNLTNPPMYFTYIVKPQKNDQGKYTPLYYTMTFRDKKTGEVLKKFGITSDDSDKNYVSAGLSETLKIKQSRDYIIEVYGSNAIIDMSIWVKPDNTFNESALKCKYWEGSLWYDF